MAVERQSSTLPPAQPSYILRGHASQIHSVQFVRQNTRLVTGDADGWLIYWKVETKRALAVWKAHDGAILGTAEWGRDKIVTHGRDNSLRVWQVRSEDETVLSPALPAEVSTGDRPMPWLLHTLPVNTLNFCALSMCYVAAQAGPNGPFDAERDAQPEADHIHASVLVAVPARDDKKVEVYQFPEEKLRYVVPRAQSKDTGMVMAVKLVQHPTTQQFLVITGYEGGLTAVHILPKADDSTIGVAQLVYLSQPHTQPILSIDVLPDATTYYTSGADAIVAAHRLPNASSTDDNTDKSLPVHEDNDDPPVSIPTHHTIIVAGTTVEGPRVNSQSTTVADDPPVSLPEELDDQALSFSKRPVQTPRPAESTPKTGGLSSLLSSAISSSSPAQSALPQPSPPSIQAPSCVNNTKHAGQQSLSVRSDGRLLATGGWDTRVRIYSTKTLKEVAVLKWHKEGVYAVAFGKVLCTVDLEHNAQKAHGQGSNVEVTRRETGLGKLQRQREEKMQVKHWIAAGAKDGKISLWEVF